MGQKYVITTAQRGAIPNWSFLESLVTYCAHNNAELLILPTNGKEPTSTPEKQKEHLHPYLVENFRIVQEDIKLNKKIAIRMFPVLSQQLVPLTSWGRYVQYDCSAIMPSPKLMQKCYANSNRDVPKILMSTGAVTRPNYKDNSWGTKARLDHKYSAIMVDIEDTHNFHYRQLVSSESGIVYDLGMKYKGSDKPLEDRAEALILGDIHVGLTDPQVINATMRLISQVRPKHIIYHDLFDCYSVNHHHTNDLFIQAQKARNGSNNLEEEVKAVGVFLDRIADQSPQDTKHLVVKSNHDEALNRYLREGRFIDDPLNIMFACQLVPNAINGTRDVLEHAIDLAYGQLQGNVKFLQPDEDFKIKGWQLASHGHYGPRGSRGNPRNLENAIGRGIVGHFHSPEIFRDIWVVGTSTVLNLYYTKGSPSDWLQTHALLHPNGKPQLINIINGTYQSE